MFSLPPAMQGLFVPDERVQDWPMVSSPLPTIGLCLCYVGFVKVLGPRMMKDREPANIRWLMVAYNFLMVLVSVYLFYKLGLHGWFGKYNYGCQPVDYSDSEDAIGMATVAYWYYISKFVEFCDTIFFVLRKKTTHVSNLHVIHHGIMPMSVWWGVKFTPGGHSTFFAFLNSFVHIIMYIYYGMSAIGPHMSKYLFWKKHMTSIQMVQFIIIFIHSFQLLFRECNFPKSFMWWIGFHAVLFWFLFWDFYKNTYLAKRSALREGKKASNGTAFFACSQTESFINGIHKDEQHAISNGSNGHAIHANGNGSMKQRSLRNGETTLVPRSEKKKEYSKELQNSRNGDSIKGKDL